MRRLSSVPVALVLAAAAACATATAAGDGQASTRTVLQAGVARPAEDVASDLLLRATALAGAGDAAGAKTLLRRVVDEFADTRSRGAATVKLAELLGADGAAAARDEARRALERYLLEEPAGDVAPAARARLASLGAPAPAAGGASKTTSATIDDVVAKTPAGERGPALVKLGRELVSRGDARQGLLALLTALPLLPATERKDSEADIIFALDQGAARGGVALHEVPALRERFARTDAFAEQVLTWKQARAALHGHDDVTAAQLAKDLLAAHPQSRFAKDAAALVDRLRARVQTDARALGVILPLSGEYAAYGKRALVAIRLAFGIPVVEDKPAEPQLNPATGEALPPKKKDETLTGTLTTPQGFSLIVKDSAGRGKTAQRAVRELVEKDHVIAVLGDILVDTSLPIALSCEEFGVPLLSLSRREGVPEAGPWSFRLALTPKKQAQALVELAVDGLQMKRFGVMYPKKAFSIELMNEFWNALDARQAEITAVESYAHDQTTFTDDAKSLVGRGIGGGGRAVAECREQEGARGVQRQGTPDHRLRGAFRARRQPGRQLRRAGPRRRGCPADEPAQRRRGVQEGDGQRQGAARAAARAIDMERPRHRHAPGAAGRRRGLRRRLRPRRSDAARSGVRRELPAGDAVAPGARRGAGLRRRAPARGAAAG